MSYENMRIYYEVEYQIGIFYLILFIFIFLFYFLKIYLFIYFWLCWVFIYVRGLSLVAASGGHSLSRPLLLRSTGSRRAGSVVVAHGPSCSAACGIFPDQGSNPCPSALAGRFSTTAPPGKPYFYFLIFNFNFNFLPNWHFLKGTSKICGLLPAALVHFPSVLGGSVLSPWHCRALVLFTEPLLAFRPASLPLSYSEIK